MEHTWSNTPNSPNYTETIEPTPDRWQNKFDLPNDEYAFAFEPEYIPEIKKTA